MASAICCFIVGGVANFGDGMVQDAAARLGIAIASL